MNPVGDSGRSARTGPWAGILLLPVRVVEFALLIPVVVACGFYLLARSLLPAAKPRRRSLLVMDISYSLSSIQKRGLGQSVLARDLGGFFEHVWTVHPLVGASQDDRAEDRYGPVNSFEFAPRHTILEGHVGRFKILRFVPYLNFVFAQWVLFRRVDRVVRRNRIGLLRAGDPYYQGPFGLLVARLNRIPLTIRIGGNYDTIFQATGQRAFPRLFPSRPWEKRVERFVLRRADLVVGANQNNLENAIRNGARADRATVFRYGNLVDPIHFDEPGARSWPPARVIKEGVEPGRFVLTVSRLETAKHVGDVVRAVAEARKESPHLKGLLIGDGTLRARLEQLALDLGAGDAIVFAGNRDQHWIAGIAPHALAVVSPQSGRALVETALAARPLVAYDTDWQGELVRDGRNGRLVPDGDWRAMARAIVELASHPKDADRWGANARTTALDMMDPQRLAAHERSMYEKLLARGTAS